MTRPQKLRLCSKAGRRRSGGYRLNIVFSASLKGLLVLTLILTVLTLPLPLLAQTTVGTGSIVGTVSDPSGLVIPGARIEITNTATEQVISLITNSSGS